MSVDQDIQIMYRSGYKLLLYNSCSSCDILTLLLGMQLDLLEDLKYGEPQQERWTFLWLDVGQVVLSLVLVSTGRARNLASKLR
jgi:hypothetical protein